MYIHKYMTADPMTIPMTTSLLEARRIMNQHSFRHLPIVDEEKRLCGIVTDRDLRSAYPSSIISEFSQKEQAIQVHKTKVMDVMTKECTILAMDATLDDALMLFDKAKVGGLPVVNAENKVVGMFSIRDLTAAYKNLFGVAEKGSVLIGLVDTGEIGIMAKIVTMFEQNGIAFTRLIRVQDEHGQGSIYVRINTFRLAAVHKLLRENGLKIIQAQSNES